MSADTTRNEHATCRAHLRNEIESLLQSANVPDSHCIASWLLRDYLHLTDADIATRPDACVSADAAAKIMAAARRCALREPVQYVTGCTDFYGLRLKVTPDVLIPRPETEQLVEAVLGPMSGTQRPRVLDIGTGSGCIALAIKHARPDAHVVACDVSSGALSVARDNAAMHHLAVDVVHADLLQEGFCSQIGMSGFDVVVSNPPYVPEAERSVLQPEIRDHEPAVALFCGTDPLYFYRAIVCALNQGVARQGGLIALESHTDYAHDVADLLRASRCTAVMVRQDYAGHARLVLAKWRGTEPEGRC